MIIYFSTPNVGNTYKDVDANVAIWDGKCVYKVDFLVPDADPVHALRTLIDANSNEMLLQEDILRSLPSFPAAISGRNVQGAQTVNHINSEYGSLIRHFNGLNRDGNMF